MVQFVNNFFSWISSIFVGFLKSSLFFLSLCISPRQAYLFWLTSYFEVVSFILLIIISNS